MDGDNDLSFYDDILYVCNNCGWDGFRSRMVVYDDVVPFTYYRVYECDECGHLHINSDYRWILEEKRQ